MGTTIQYGTAQEIQDLYNQLPDKAADAEAIMKNVRTDGTVEVNGKFYALPLFIEAALEKFGMSFISSTLSYFAGYPNVQFSAVLQTFLNTGTVVNILADYVEGNNITLEKLDPEAYHQGLISAYKANPVVFREAYYQRALDANGVNSYQNLLQQLNMSSFIDNNKLRNPMKNAPELNVPLLLFLARTGQISLLMMMIYKYESQSSSQMQMTLVKALGQLNKMKRKIMKAISGLGKESADDPMMAQKMQEINARFSQLKSVEEVMTAMMKDIQENLQKFFNIVEKLSDIQHQTVMAAARA